MLSRLLLASVFVGMGFTDSTKAQETKAVVAKWIDANQSKLQEVYQHLHSNPEVSFQEKETGQYVGKAWDQAGFAVTNAVGGYGVVGVLVNGEGPTLMLRTDLDALPVGEETPLEFASQKKVTTASGAISGVMHACGHDVHMTNLIGVAQFLGEHRELWSGKIILVGQPAEERGAGARAMLDDGLFKRFGKPDFAIALHCEAQTASGKVAVSPGYSMANVDSVDILVKGKGGHGSAPHTTVDPIVQAADLVMSLQTIVAREIDPQAPAVVTVGAINGGTKHNIIGNTCALQLTVRSYSDEVRRKLLSAIERKANAVAQAYNAPKPEVKFSEGTPSLKNDEVLTARVVQSFQKAIGEDNVLPIDPVMGGEDFSQYGRAGVPIVMYRLGVVSEERLQKLIKDQGQAPSLHSSKFYPDIDEALPVGLKTMIQASLDLLPN